ncbi:MAG: 2-succinyl-5-enolpyruvyl-6-hydroxy-3-cyclohexene-1-carboxylic-acid synthase [Cyclobacteriaceae bacterium]
MLSQAIYDIPQLLHLLGIKDVIISPGSRSAPLTIAFARHPAFNKYVVPDERSAAFMALGMSQQTRKPTVLVCTSGSAAYNYAPAVAEAYYQQIPMLIITADRPPEWIDQWDGQTIRQQNIYGNHVLKSYQLPSTDPSKEAQWHLLRSINEAALLAEGTTQGPVHINVPLREPLYPTGEISYSQDLKVWNEQRPANQSFEIDLKELKQFSRIVIIPGQQSFDQGIADQLSKLARKLPVICDAQSNYSSLEGVVTHHDLFLAGKTDTSLAPELVITFGKSIISKNLKLFLRGVQGLQHWHINEGDFNPDTLQSLTKVIKCESHGFLSQLSEISIDSSYLENWTSLESKTDGYLSGCFGQKDFSEFEAISNVMDILPDHTDLHVANSMAIRYVNFLGLKNATQRLFVNRGTSGIDGSVSTTVGSAIAGRRKTVLLTGDLAFFYDRNGLWHNHPPEDLMIVLLNNHGGGIFGMIPGPRSQPELDEYFITRQDLGASNTAKDFGMDYQVVNERNNLAQALDEMINQKGLRLLEVETSTSINQQVFDTVKSEIKNL